MVLKAARGHRTILVPSLPTPTSTMSTSALPESHPAIHEHKGRTCPVTGQTHDFCAAQEGDSRSPCPALNTMANHGYIARDGKNISATEIVGGLKKCYGLSTPLALFLAHVGFLVLRKTFRRVSLFEIGKHGQVEHDASLVHHDTPQGQVYAPIAIDAGLVDKLIGDVEGGVRMNAVDVARARIRREKQSPVLDGVHAEIARGEMAIILGVWEEGTAGKDKLGIPVDWMRRWIHEEKLPEGWKPQRTQGLLDTMNRSKAIRTAMEEFRKAEAAEAVEDEKVDEKSKL